MVVLKISPCEPCWAQQNKLFFKHLYTVAIGWMISFERNCPYVRQMQIASLLHFHPSCVDVVILFVSLEPCFCNLCILWSASPIIEGGSSGPLDACGDKFCDLNYVSGFVKTWFSLRVRFEGWENGIEFTGCEENIRIEWYVTDVIFLYLLVYGEKYFPFWFLLQKSKLF